MEIIRKPYLAEKIVIVDGLPGCGKTMLSPIIAALDRVEKLSYCYELELTCHLNYLKKMEPDAAVTLIRILMDLKLYNLMMAREVNFRPSDLSSVFHDAQPLRYIKRAFQKGDEAVPDRIKKEKPILHLATHRILNISEPIFSALENRIFFVEVVRHPLYMVKQQILNMERIMFNPRHFTLYFDYKGSQLPYFTHGWEELFMNSNNTEKAIYEIEKLTEATDLARKKIMEKYNGQILTIPFEKFVVNPWPYMEQIEAMLGTKITATTRRMMKRQNVPRKMYAEGIGLKIYKRCGWEPPKSSNEKHEFEMRRQFVADKASAEAMHALDRICADYEEKYMDGRKKTGEHYE